MLIDCNAYIGHWPFRQRQFETCEGLLKSMDRFGVSMAVVSNMNGIFYKNAQAANEELHAQLNADSNARDRIIPFAVINPIYGGWKNDFEESSTAMGMKGIRLFPRYHGYSLTNPACVELVKMARDRGLPVALCLRMVDARPGSWMDLPRASEWALQDVLPIIKAVPDARYLILNVANNANLNEEDTATMKKTEVIMDTSGRNIINLGEMLRRFGSEKFAFGTHSPILDEVTGLLRIESLRKDEADDATKAMLRSGNAKRFFRISKGDAP